MPVDVNSGGGHHDGDPAAGSAELGQVSADVL
jgi:hypothetical protein